MLVTRPSNRGRIVALLGFAWSSLPALAAASEPTKNECIDANETAQSLRKNGKILEAEQRLRVCVAASCPGPVRDDCAQRLTEVRSATPTIVFVVKDDADQDLSAVHVTMDGAPLVDNLDGTAIALDPGEHRFVFEADGRMKEERTLLMHEGEKDRHERIVLVRSPPIVTPPVNAPVAAEPPPVSNGNPRRIAGIAVGAAGAVGVVIGSVFGILAKSTYDHAFTECDSKPNGCNSNGNGQADGQTAHHQATVSTVAFVAGAALLGGGALLYFTAPGGSTVAVGPSAGPGAAGLAVRGRWW